MFIQTILRFYQSDIKVYSGQSVTLEHLSVVYVTKYPLDKSDRTILEQKLTEHLKSTSKIWFNDFVYDSRTNTYLTRIFYQVNTFLIC